MKPTTARLNMRYRKIGAIALTVVLAVFISGLSSSVPARADGDDRGRNVQRERGHEDRRASHRSYHRNEAPRYVYAPPPVYYTPPPRRPAIDFVFPLNFR